MTEAVVTLPRILGNKRLSRTSLGMDEHSLPKDPLSFSRSSSVNDFSGSRFLNEFAGCTNARKVSESRRSLRHSQSRPTRSFWGMRSSEFSQQHTNAGDEEASSSLGEADRLAWEAALATTVTVAPRAHAWSRKGSMEPDLQLRSSSRAGLVAESSKLCMIVDRVSSSFRRPAQVSDFLFMGQLGSGAFGCTRQATHQKTGKTFAVKILKKSAIVKAKKSEALTHELSVLLQLRHPFISELHGCFHDKGSVYLVSDFCSGGTLLLHLQRQGCCNEDTAVFWVAGVVVGIEHCHAKNIIHRDIHPRNVLLGKDGHPKLTGFGVAKAVDHLTYTLCGTPEYAAPEALHGKGYTRAVDWWALGNLIYEMRAGEPAFKDEDPMRVYDKILRGKVSFGPNFSKDSKSLVRQLLTSDVGKRPGCGRRGMEELKKHRWFASTHWPGMAAKAVRPPAMPDFNPEVDPQSCEEAGMEHHPVTNW